MYQTSIDTLMKRVRIENGCWLWQGPTVGRGYGKVGFRGKTARAHRVMWELVNGEIPAGLYVCHKCDTPSCINPDHLFLGTADENNKDMAKKGRSAKGEKNGSFLHPERRPKGNRHYSRTNPEKLLRGERHGNAKLTDSQVREIRNLYAGGKYTLKQLAAKFHTSTCPIHHIVSGKSWKHVL